MSEFINDKNLSLKAKGALSMLLSLKNLNKKRIIELSKDGKDSVNSAIIELQEKRLFANIRNPRKRATGL